MPPAPERIVTRLVFSRAFGYLTPRRREAVIRALLLTMAPAGKPEPERIWIRYKLLQLPWAWELDESAEDGLVRRDRFRVEPVHDRRRLLSLSRELAAELGDTRLRRAVYRLMVALYHADGGADGGTGRAGPLDAVRRGFGLPPEAAQSIQESVRKQIARQATRPVTAR